MFSFSARRTSKRTVTGIFTRETTRHSTRTGASGSSWSTCGGCVTPKSSVNSYAVCQTLRKFAYTPGSSSFGTWIWNSVGRSSASCSLTDGDPTAGSADPDKMRTAVEPWTFVSCAHDLVGGERPGEPLELQLADRLGLDAALHGRPQARPDQDLPGHGERAQPRREVCHRPERAIVVAALESDPAERRVAGLDPHAEGELRSTAAPARRQLLEPLAECEREADRLQLVVLDRHRVVEEHHDAVSRELLQRAAMLREQRADGAVVCTQHFDQILGRSRLGEPGEVAQVGEEAGDVGAVAGEDLLAVR